MTISENDRLDLRQEFERIFKNPRLAEIAMQAMPPLDYSQLATKQDLGALRSDLKGDIAELRGEIGELRGEMHRLQATTIRSMFAGQLVTIGILGSWITAVT